MMTFKGTILLKIHVAKYANVFTVYLKVFLLQLNLFTLFCCEVYQFKPRRGRTEVLHTLIQKLFIKVLFFWCFKINLKTFALYKFLVLYVCIPLLDCSCTISFKPCALKFKVALLKAQLQPVYINLLYLHI
jgi:hypothetical protein